MRDLHKFISYRNPESLVGAFIFEALNIGNDNEIKIKLEQKEKTEAILNTTNNNKLEAILSLPNDKESQTLINTLKFEFEYTPIKWLIKNKTDSSNNIEIHIHTNQHFFYKFNYHLTNEYNEFDEIIKEVSNESTPILKKNIDDFLVEVGFLPKKNSSDSFDWDREWDIEYNKVVLALNRFEEEERFILFAKYVYYSMAVQSISRESVQSIWKNKTLWFEKYYTE